MAGHDERAGTLLRVADPADGRIAAYRDLRDSELRRRREAADAIFVVEGRVAVHQLLDSPYAVESLLLDDHQAEAVPDLVAAVRATGATVYVGTRTVVAATVGFPLHRGIVAIARRPGPLEAGELVAGALAVARADAGRARFAVVEGVNDHENLGALFRNAAAFGVAAVLLDPTCADPLYRRSVRVSVGHVLTVPFARLVPWPAALHDLRTAGVTVVALAPHPPGASTATSLRALAGSVATPGVAVLVGAEGPGLSPAALAAADATVAVPMAPGVDSLNVATAAAIAFYELARRGQPVQSTATRSAEHT